MQDFDALIHALALAPTTENMDAVIGAARGGKLSDAQIASLAETLANSGEVLTFPDSSTTADIASTGGPSSLTTLLCPLFLRVLGAIVPKLGVPGRPAGAVDVLAQIRGYQIALTTEQAAATIRECGYAHCITSERHAPLDGALFKRRLAVGATAVPELAIASLLSKKIAMCVRNVGLDVRVASHGNFGGTWNEARTNAKQFIRVAKLLGIHAHCFLTSASTPCQPYIGRSEALLALAEYFSGTQREWLNQHIIQCFVLSKTTLGKTDAALPEPEALRQQFALNIESQGGSLASFEQLVQRTASVIRRPIRAASDGFVAIDLAAIRDTLVNANATPVGDDGPNRPFADVAGIVLRRQPGAYALQGDVLAEVRVDADLKTDVDAALAHAIRVVPIGDESYGYEEV